MPLFEDEQPLRLRDARGRFLPAKTISAATVRRALEIARRRTTTPLAVSTEDVNKCLKTAVVTRIFDLTDELEALGDVYADTLCSHIQRMLTDSFVSSGS